MFTGTSLFSHGKLSEIIFDKNLVVVRSFNRSEDELSKEAERPEMLIPITIDFDVQSTHPDQQGLKIRDRFLWNLNEPFITPYQFSIIFCEDIGIPISPYAQRIQDLIEKQIEENQNAAEIDVTNEEVTENDVVWSDEEVEEVMDDAVENGDGNKDGDDKSKEQQLEEDQEQEQEQGEKEDKERSRKRKREREGKDGKERNWAESDCRIIVNVSFLSSSTSLERLKHAISSTSKSTLTSCATASNGTFLLPFHHPFSPNTTAPNSASPAKPSQPSHVPSPKNS